MRKKLIRLQYFLFSGNISHAMRISKTGNVPYTGNSHMMLPPAEDEFLRLLRSGDLTFPPCELELLAVAKTNTTLDGVLRMRWGEEVATFRIDYRPINSPRDLKGHIAMAYYRSHHEAEGNIPPLLVRPYLPEADLILLDRNGISGFDLCGNGVVFMTPKVKIWRSGYPNRFRISKPIQNPYEGDSAIFARCFLLKPRFSSLSELREFAHLRSANANKSQNNLVLSTASKVVNALIDDMVVEKTGRQLELANRKRLLKLLKQNSTRRSANQTPSLVGKTSLSENDIWLRLREARHSHQIRSVATGVFSAKHYALLSGLDTTELNVSSIAVTREILEIRPSRAFPNVVLYEERKNLVYFDARQDSQNENILWASPIQTWLDLWQRGPREQEASEQLEQLLEAGNADSI